MGLTFTPVVKSSGHFDAVLRARFSADGRRLASVGADGQLRVVDLEAEQCVAAVALHTGCIHDISWDATRQFVYTTGSEGDVVCTAVSSLPATTPVAPRQPSDPEPPGVVARFPHHTHNDTQPQQSLHSLYKAPTAVSSPHFIGQYIVTGGYDAMLRQWDTRKFGFLVETRTHEAPISSLEHNHDDTLIASSSLDGLARLWDTNNMCILGTYTGADGVPLVHADFSPNSHQLLCIPLETNPCLWEVLDPAQCTVLEEPLVESSAPQRSQRDIHSERHSLPCPSPEKPFCGHTAAEFLTSPGPFVFGTFALDGDFVMVPKAPTKPLHFQESLYGVAVWSSVTGQCETFLRVDPHRSCPVTSVASSPVARFSNQLNTLIATSGDFPDNSCVIWCAVFTDDVE